MSEWQRVKFEDLLVGKKISYGVVQPGQFQEVGGVPLIRVNNIKNAKVDVSDIVKIHEDVEAKYSKTRLCGGELLITVVGSVGECAIVTAELKGFNVARAVSVANIVDGVDKRFVAYQFRTEDLKFQMYGNTNDTVQPTLNLTELKQLTFTLPPLPEQKAIASVLSSLDDKIDLLHRQNKTLEAMAETLFRQWFIEEAKEDWKETKVLDVFSLVGGGTPKTSEASYWDGDIPWLSGGDIANAHQGFIVKAEKAITELGLEKSSTKLLPKLASVISARGTVGKYAMLSRPMTFSQSNYGIIPKGHTYYYFVYLLLAYIVDELSAAAYGSVFDTITTRTFEDVEIKLPSMDFIAQFESEIAPLFEKKLNNVEQIQTLENLRDTLLPKLMSGEVRVQYQTEEVA